MGSLVGFLKNKSLLLIAGAAIIGLPVAAANAGSLTLGDSGWTASWDASNDNYLGLNVDGVTSSTVFIEKALNYTTPANEDGSFDPVLITFSQTRADALPFIAINDESVTNHSGSDWTGFRFTLDNAAFDSVGSNVGNTGGFAIDPFTNGVFSLGDTVLTTNGGTVQNGKVWFPGSGAGNLLILTPGASEAGLASFTLGEGPVGGSTPVIPLPPAFWSGLIGLGALGLLGAGNKMLKHLH